MLPLKKPVIAAILAVALIADVAVFVGIGFGISALGIAGGTPLNAAAQTTQAVADFSQWNASIASAMAWYVTIDSYQSAGQIPTTSFSSSGDSNTITAAIHVYTPSGDNCGNAGNPVWAPGAPGTGEIEGFTISFSSPFKIEAGGQQYVSSLLTKYLGNERNTIFIPYANLSEKVSPAACINALGTDNTNLQAYPGVVAATISFTMKGLYDPGRLDIGTYTLISHCNSLLGPSARCNAGEVAVGLSSGYLGESGTYHFVVYASINTYSGQAYVLNANPNQVVYNGGTATFIVSTGYDGPSSSPYTLTMDYPKVLGGGPDPSFAPISVPNFEYSQPYSWHVPAGTGTACGTPQCNEFQAVLTATGGPGYVEGSADANVVISPAVQPDAPFVQIGTTGSFSQPQVGDTVTISVEANASAGSTLIAGVVIQAFYADQSVPPGSLPSCGADWVVGIPCPQGDYIAVSPTSHAVVHHQFVVNPPPDATDGFWVIVWSESTQQQASNATMIWTTIVPSNCVPGMAGCPAPKGTSAWTWIGPLLLSIAIALAAVLIAVIAPSPQLRFLSLAAAAALIALGYVWFWAVLFAPGAFLAPGLG